VYLYLGLSYIKVNRAQDALSQFETCMQVAAGSCVAAECRHYLNLLQEEKTETAFQIN
jgi:hypothetical protein